MYRIFSTGSLLPGFRRTERRHGAGLATHSHIVLPRWEHRIRQMEGAPFLPSAAVHLPARNPGDEDSRRTRGHGDEVRGGWHPQPGMTPAAASIAGPTPGAGGAVSATPEWFRLLRVLWCIMRKTRTRSLTGSNRQILSRAPPASTAAATYLRTVSRDKPVLHRTARRFLSALCQAASSRLSGRRQAGNRLSAPSRGFPYGFASFL